MIILSKLLVQLMQNQPDKQLNKFDYLKPFQELYLRISFNRQQPEIIPYPLSFDTFDDKNSSLTIKVDTILKIASSLILKKKIKLTKFMNIFVEIDHKLINLFKLKKGLLGQSEGNIFKIKRQDQCFYLNIWIFDLQKIEKTNPLLELTNQSIKYQKIIEKLQKINEVFTKQIQNLNDEQKSSYDIAYFFAQPLVQPQKIQDFPSRTQIYENLKLDKYRASGSDVSFQKEYDKFINVIQAENFFANITIEMMVATENNIRQVLSERCNILHFSCHGQVEYLKIEKDRNVGYLDALTSARLIKLLDGKALPKIIIFNACYSRKIASDVHERFPQITTIGYEGKADDNYCQILTQRLYSGIYGRKQPFFKLFEQVKSQIASKKPQQAKKLYIFKAQTQFKFDKTDFPVNQNYNINWAYFQNLGKKQPIGIKLKLFQFIKNYLLNSQKTKFFVVGEPQSGKSVFIKKALYYTMHRCVFRQKLYIDLRKGQKPIVNMLELKLQYKKLILNFIKQNKTTNFIIVIDHCNDLIRNDPEEFMKFFKKVQRQIKLGKLILISDNISYFMEINILIDQNVYDYEEVIPAKEPKIKDDYNTYMNRWHQNLDKNWTEFLKHRIREWFEALGTSDSKQSFTQNLQKIKNRDQEKQSQKLMVNLQLEFDTFRDKILKTQRIIKAYLTSGYYSRSHQCFILLNIFPQFIKQTQKLQPPKITKLQPRQKHSYIQELTTCYEEDIKTIINHVIQALGKFHTQTYQRSWWESQLLFLTEKLFVIIGLAILIKDSKEGEKQVQEQLFNAYTFITKLFNRYQKILSELPRLMNQCESMKLKLYMAMYNFYKHHEHLRTVKEKALNSDHYQKPRSEISSVNAVDVGFSINFLQTIPVLDGFKESLKQNNSLVDSGNVSEFGFGVSQRDSVTNNYMNRDRRDSIRSQNDFSSIRPSINPNTQFSQDRQVHERKQSTFKDFQMQLKEQYGQSQYWQLIQKVTELDTMIRGIQSQQSRQLVIDPGSMVYTSSAFEFSSSENQRTFQTYYFQVERFYCLHNNVTILFERLESCYGFDDYYDVEVCKVRKVFFGQVQLDLCYLQGLKIVSKLIQVVNDEYFFDYEVWYKEKLNNIRDKMIKTQKILDWTIARKLNNNRDLSYKKVYKQYLQLYIDLRFKLQKLYSSYTPNGEKELLGIFNKLLKLSDDARSIQLKNRIQEFIQKNFYNKCSLLISQPIGYIPKHKSFSFNQKDNKKPKANIKKEPTFQSEKIMFYPLNIYRTSDMIINQIKNATQKKLASQIHIEAQVLNFQRLSSYSIQKTEEDSRKKRLIYLIMCDCKKSAHHETFFIENDWGESIKKYFKAPNSHGFPYAPVIILYGSNAELLQSYYRQYAQYLQRKIAIIMLPTSKKLPQIQSENWKQMFKYVWSEYLQKHMGVSFLSSFWTKFCQIYFDEEHESFRNQVIRSFNIAKQESLILLKKKYLEGINASHVQNEIDHIVGRLSLRIQNKYETDEPVDLENKVKFVQNKEHQLTQGSINVSKEDEFLRSSTLYQSVRREDEVIALNNHEIGSNYQIHQFMQVFFENIQLFEKDLPFNKNFIEYHAQISETNLISFVKAIYHKLLRMGNKFEGGVEFKNMGGFKLDNNSELFNVFDQNLASSTLIGSMGMGQGLEIKEEDSVDYESSMSEEVPAKKQKKVQIYYNIAHKDLKLLIQGFKSRDESLHHNTGLSHFTQSAKPAPTTTFRILIVDASFIDYDMKYYLQSSHSCRVNSHQIRHSFLENMYHACDAILHYSKRVEGFSFNKIIDELYNKKNPVDSLKHLTPRQVKDKIVEFFEKHYP